MFIMRCSDIEVSPQCVGCLESVLILPGCRFVCQKKNMLHSFALSCVQVATTKAPPKKGLRFGELWLG